MPRHELDKSSKWMIQHQGQGVLFLGEAPAVRRYRALQAEVVQPRQLPDGLLEVYFQGTKGADHVLVEVVTYPDKVAADAALDDLLLVFLDRRIVPDLLTVVLRPRGRVQVGESKTLQSRLGWSQLSGRWKVVTLWTIPAERLLTAGDVGLLPWVPLTHFAGSPELLLRQCRERIERQARPEERANLLAVTQVMTRLRFPNPNLLTLLGGRRVMIESPLLQEIMAESKQEGRMEATHEAIARVLRTRFGEVPAEVLGRLRAVLDGEQLATLLDLAVVCPTLEGFRLRLMS